MLSTDGNGRRCKDNPVQIHCKICDLVFLESFWMSSSIQKICWGRKIEMVSWRVSCLHMWSLNVGQTLIFIIIATRLLLYSVSCCTIERVVGYIVFLLMAVVALSWKFLNELNSGCWENGKWEKQQTRTY